LWQHHNNTSRQNLAKQVDDSLPTIGKIIKTGDDSILQ
jgi:hypothetical protein